MARDEPQTDHFDVLIVGAGISGIDTAYRLKTRCKDKSWLILEARERIGGTWDLFRYPGVRSDSDIFTLGFPFRPWPSRQGDRRGLRNPRLCRGHRARVRHFRSDSLRPSRQGRLLVVRGRALDGGRRA